MSRVHPQNNKINSAHSCFHVEEIKGVLSEGFIKFLNGSM